MISLRPGHVLPKGEACLTRQPNLASRRGLRRFGGLQALRGVTIGFNRGEVLGLIGPNGAGKTTLVNTICGVTPAGGGTVTFLGKDITRIKTYQSARLGLARTFQIVQPFAEFSALDNVAAAALFSQPQ